MPRFSHLSYGEDVNSPFSTGLLWGISELVCANYLSAQVSVASHFPSSNHQLKTWLLGTWLTGTSLYTTSSKAPWMQTILPESDGSILVSGGIDGQPQVRGTWHKCFWEPVPTQRTHPGCSCLCLIPFLHTELRHWIFPTVERERVANHSPQGRGGSCQVGDTSPDPKVGLHSHPGIRGKKRIDGRTYESSLIH